MRRLFWVGPALAAVVLVALVVLVTMRRSEDTLEQARRSGVIRVGYAPEAPFAFRAPNGTVTGESPEIAREVLRRMGIARIEWVQTEWGALIPELKARQFDIIAAGMFITCERAREVAFTRPTFRLGEALLVAQGNPRQLHSYADIKVRADVHLAVVRGAIEYQIAQAQGIPDERILAVPDAQTGLVAVRSGRVDALALTSMSVDRLAASDPTHVERAMPFDAPLMNGQPVAGYGALAVRPEDDALLQALNAELAQIVGSDEHLRLVARFGFSRDDLPPQDAPPLSNCQ